MLLIFVLIKLVLELILLKLVVIVEFKSCIKFVFDEILLKFVFEVIVRLPRGRIFTTIFELCLRFIPVYAADSNFCRLNPNIHACVL